MKPIFQKEFEITDMCVDCFGRLKPSVILFFAQQAAGMHCTELSLGYDTLASLGLFWAVSRHKVEVSRLPRLGETIRVETWPMPTTRVAYPRSLVAYDGKGNECFRVITLWVLMRMDTRAMITPGKSGIIVAGTLRGGELPSPAGLIPRAPGSRMRRAVRYTDLDRNGHMNNTRCLEWIEDLLPSAFHRDCQIREFTVCYLSEAREGMELELGWELQNDGHIQVDASRTSDGETHRVFSALLRYDKIQNSECRMQP